MAHGEEFSNTLLVSVEGTPLPDDVRPQLVGGFVDDSTNVPDMFVLRFTDAGGVVLAKGGFAIGAKVELALQTTAPTGKQVLLKGEVTAIEVEVGEKGTYTVVRGLDASHRLFRGTRTEAFVNMTASDIVAKVAGRAGLPVKVDQTSPPLPHTSQDGVNDWDFLRRLAAENNRVLTLSDGTLQFTTRPEASEAPAGASDSRTNPLVLELGVSLVSLRGTLTAAGQVPSVEVRGWDPRQKKEVKATKPAATTSAQPGGGLTPSSVAQVFDSAPYVLGLPSLETQDGATAIAASLADHLAGGFAELEGTARGNPGLRAGTAVVLANVGQQFGGRYVLTSTRHEFSPDRGYLTTFTASNTSERSLYGAANATARERPRMPGAVPAVVTNVKDPDALGRVKLKYPWLHDTYESAWARTVQQGAGKDRGTAILPEVGDEVLVCFAQGDFERPYVLGGLYNGKDLPHGGWAEQVDSGSGQVVHRGFTSRTGMKVALLEKAGAASVVLSTNDGAQKIELTQTAAKGIAIAAEGDLRLEAKGNITLSTSSGDVTLKGTNIKLDATASLELGGQQVAVKGTTVKVEGQGTAELTSTGATTVKGSIVRIN